jgi:hypothetical protein
MIPQLKTLAAEKDPMADTAYILVADAKKFTDLHILVNGLPDMVAQLTPCPWNFKLVMW